MHVGNWETAVVMLGAEGGGTGEWKDVKFYVNSKSIYLYIERVEVYILPIVILSSSDCTLLGTMNDDGGSGLAVPLQV